MAARGPGRALTLSHRALELDPGRPIYLNTRGVVLYRAGRFAEALTTLDESLEAGKGEFDGFDLHFLAMAHHRLGHRDEARRCLDRAIGWTGRRSSLSARRREGAGGLPRRGRGRPGRSDGRAARRRVQAAMIRKWVPCRLPDA